GRCESSIWSIAGTISTTPTGNKRDLSGVAALRHAAGQSPHLRTQGRARRVLGRLSATSGSWAAGARPQDLREADSALRGHCADSATWQLALDQDTAHPAATARSKPPRPGC